MTTTPKSLQKLRKVQNKNLSWKSRSIKWIKDSKKRDNPRGRINPIYVFWILASISRMTLIHYCRIRRRPFLHLISPSFRIHELILLEKLSKINLRNMKTISQSSFTGVNKHKIWANKIIIKILARHRSHGAEKSIKKKVSFFKKIWNWDKKSILIFRFNFLFLF